MFKFLCFIFICFFMLLDGQQIRKSKTILTVLLARNKEHILPYFLTLFEKLSYPKNRISLFIRSDHNQDKTVEILDTWLSIHESEYHSVDAILNRDQPYGFPHESSPTNWTAERFHHIMDLKDVALNKGNHLWADYILFLDVDALILDENMIENLIEENKPIISPMLNSLGTYSNYWCGMTENYYYKRTEDYLPILNRKNKGCFSVPMVHSCVLVDLTLIKSNKLTFNPVHLDDYYGPKDDIIVFALSSRINGMDMYVCNEKVYGFIPPPLNENDILSKDYQQLIDIRLEVLVEHPPLPVSRPLARFLTLDSSKSKLGFDNVYLINLPRRQDRRFRMYHSFDALEIEAELFEAVDGKKINASYLENLNVKQLENYKDPWAQRDMTYGEIGCFLSHYFIWEDIVENGYDKVIVFEDDIRFEPYFKAKLKYMMKQIEQISLNWDFIYLGRKNLHKADEPWVEGSDILVHADYSYWTLAYIITQRGARKLLRPQPLHKMVPVDEYVPIMFDKHPKEQWKSAFASRNLNAFSASPLMIFPTHYTGDEGYVSDTEDSTIIEDLLKVSGIQPIGPNMAMEVNGLQKDEL